MTTVATPERNAALPAAWISCALIATLLHVAWAFAVPPPRDRIPPRAPRTPHVSFMGEAAGHPRADVRVLWSPELFAVPSSLGFSETLLGERIAFGPRARVVPPQPIMAERDATWGRGVPSPVEETLAALVSSAASSLPLRSISSPVFIQRASSTSIILHIAWTDQSGGSGNVSVDVGRVDPWVDSKPWEAGALLDVDAVGTVQHVFLETPTSLKDRNGALVRILSGIRFDPGPERSRRVLIRYEGSYAGGEAATP
jgi:hypothetical protein